MSANLILYIMLAILVVDFMVEKTLDILNLKNWSPNLPKLLQGIYNNEKYLTSQKYQKEKYKLRFVSSSVSFVLVFFMISCGGFSWLDAWVRTQTTDSILVALLFFGIIMFASNLIALPFSYYATFVIEEKYGFNKTTIKTFVLDIFKSGFLSFLIGGVLLAVLIWIYQQTTTNFWWMGWLVVAMFMIFMNLFYSSLIVPLFNKQTLLEEGELKDEITKFANKTNFSLEHIYVMDGSKRSTKGNAYFSGLGSKKRIVLFDTLMNDLSTQEIVAVLAHEIGHYKKKHTRSGMLLALLQTGLMFYIFSIFIGNAKLSEALGASEHGFHLGLIAFGILYSPISSLLNLGMNQFSRHNEYEADAFVKENYNAQDLGNALIQLSENSLSNLTPHKAYVFVYHSHPNLLQRLKAIAYENKLHNKQDP